MNNKNEEYYFSVIDVINVLTDRKFLKRYWLDLKVKLVDEGSEVYEEIVRLKIKGKKILEKTLKEIYCDF